MSWSFATPARGVCYRLAIVGQIRICRGAAAGATASEKVGGKNWAVRFGMERVPGPESKRLRRPRRDGFNPGRLLDVRAEAILWKWLFRF